MSTNPANISPGRAMISSEPGDSALDKLEYVTAVISQVHAKTLQGGLAWKTTLPGLISAEPTPSIYVMINFDDDGPDSAVWESVVVKHPSERE